MRTRLTEQLETSEVKMLRGLGQLASELGMRLFLAGGSVRDIILGRPHDDWDFALEGDGPQYATELAARWHGRAIVHDQFLTATVRFGDGSYFDVATTRRETYACRGALPVVQPASIEQDLWRRDFTINAIAVALGPDEWGRVIDPTGGRDDLEARVVRALHERSFDDDATRIVRAIGFEQRLGFRIEPQTEGWVRKAASSGALHTVSTERLGDVIVPLLREGVGPQVLKRGNELGVARAMGARAAFTPRALEALDHLPEALGALGEDHRPDRRVIGCLTALLLGRGVTADRVVERLHLDRFSARELRCAERFTRLWPDGFIPGRRDGDLWEQLREATFAGVLALWLSTGSREVRGALERYWTQLRGTRPDFDPDDLRHMGFAPSPHFGAALRVAILSKLNHRAGPQEQLAAAAQVLQNASSGE